LLNQIRTAKSEIRNTLNTLYDFKRINKRRVGSDLGTELVANGQQKAGKILANHVYVRSQHSAGSRQKRVRLHLISKLENQKGKSQKRNRKSKRKRILKTENLCEYLPDIEIRGFQESTQTAKAGV